MPSSDRVDADVFLLTDNLPAILPGPQDGLSVTYTKAANAQLLDDLRSDEGMRWVRWPLWCRSPTDRLAGPAGWLADCRLAGTRRRRRGRWPAYPGRGCAAAPMGWTPEWSGEPVCRRRAAVRAPARHRRRRRPPGRSGCAVRRNR